MHEKSFNYYSHILNRDIPIVVHGHWGKPMILFPTSLGTVWQNKDFGLIESARQYIDGSLLKIYNVGTLDNDTFYAKHYDPHIRIHNYNLYTRFINEEFIPFVQSESNTHRIGIGGCSFGAYHASNIAFKFPDKIDFLLSMSGSFDIKSFLNGFYNDEVFYNNPTDYLPGSEGWIYHHIKIILGTSDWDSCKAANQNLSQLLSNKMIDHLYDEKKWAKHDWPLWRMMFPEYLRKVL